VGKTAGLVLVVLGLLLGPGSQIAGRFFSGRVLVEAPLDFAGAGAPGRTARVAFRLPADALPAAVVVEASAGHGPVTRPGDLPGDTWTLRLLRDGKVVREQPMRLQSGTVEATPAEVFKEAIALDATAGGGYELEVVLPAAPRLALDAARVEVRAGVSEADPTWLTAGLVLIAAGVVLLIAG
jgi:hypothetical protein